MRKIVFDCIKVDLILDLFKTRDKLSDIFDVKQELFDRVPTKLLDLVELFDVKFIVPDGLYLLAVLPLIVSSSILIELWDIFVIRHAYWRVLLKLVRWWILNWLLFINCSSYTDIIPIWFVLCGNFYLAWSV